MNIAKELIIDEAEKIQLAHFNLIAGKKAKQAVAYSSAFNYIKNCIDLLEEPTCKKEYDLCLKVHIEGAEIAYINGDFVLVSVSEKIKSVIGPKASLSRWGGEEFLALFPSSHQ